MAIYVDNKNVWNTNTVELQLYEKDILAIEKMTVGIYRYWNNE